MSGVRKSLLQEFSKILVINLRGDIRKNMLSQGRAGEGENIFNDGSMTGITISLFIKNSTSIKENSHILYYDIGDDLSVQEKKDKLANLQSIKNITWQEVIPDSYGDWINQRNDNFINIGAKKDTSAFYIFHNYSLGLSTNRDQ